MFIYNDIIEKKIFQIVNSVDISHNNMKIGLFNGDAGIAIMYYYSSLLINHGKKCRNKLENVIDSINEGCRIGSFCSGISGFGWVMEFLFSKNIISKDEILLLDNFDVFLYKNMIHSFNNQHYDYLHGAIGYGMYFLKRLRKPKSIEYIKSLVNHIDKMGYKSSNNIIKWYSIIDKDNAIKGTNISLSHGMSSIISILTKIYNVDVEKEKCKRLVTGAINYIMQQRINNIKYTSYFPSMSKENNTKTVGSRLAWCYGDLGIGISLWNAGKAFNNTEWVEKAIEILMYSTERRNLKENSVIDGGLCHGTAGIGLIFYRMYWNTKKAKFKETADYWFNETLKMAYHKNGLAGFKTYYPDKDGNKWINESNVLEGTAGIGLALMSYFYEIEPDWDEFLLLS